MGAAPFGLFEGLQQAKMGAVQLWSLCGWGLEKRNRREAHLGNFPIERQPHVWLEHLQNERVDINPQVRPIVTFWPVTQEEPGR